MSAQRRLQVLLGHLSAVPAEQPSGTTPSVRADSTAPHQFQQDLEQGHAQRGVLAYGLEGPGREPLRATWQPPIADPQASSHAFSKSTDLIDTKGLTTVDRYNNLTWREFPKRHSGAFGPFGPHGSALDEPGLSSALTGFRVAEGTAAALSPMEMSQVESFQQGLLAHPHYSPFRTRADKVQDLMKKEGMDDPVKAQFRCQTIRACKFGIEYGQLEGRQVMFELGGLHSPDAASKANVGRQASGGGAQLRSITNAELRKAFRHDVSDQSLQFYRGGDKAEAPWSKLNPEGAAWASYMQKRVAKYQKLGFKPDFESSVKAASGSGTRAGFRDLNAQINAFKRTLPKPSKQAPILSKL